MSKVKKFLIIAVVSLAVLAVAFVAWTSMGAEATETAVSALQSTNNVTVSTTEEGWLIFQPARKETTSGLVIYPGGKVDARAYAPLAQDIAEAGYFTVITPMPFDLAVLAPYRANQVIETYSSIDHWAIAGHSLGGSMAAVFINKYPDKVEGIAFWASYTTESQSLHDSDIDAVVVYGTNDGLAEVEEIEDKRPYFPQSTQWIVIDGGNHAQFGWYGQQAGDNAATISPEAQQTIIVSATVQLLEEIRNP